MAEKYREKSFYRLSGSLAGGALGGRLAGRIKPVALRRIVVAIGLVAAGIYFVR